jgi:tetratricopeptide (TPR) repeat protein
MQHCPTLEQLRQVIFGEGASLLEREALRQHLQDCETCRRALDQASDDADLRVWKGSLIQSGTAAVELRPELIERILRDSPSSRTLVRGGESTDGFRAPRQFSSLAPGTQLGRLELVEEVGRGGMAIVYKARDLDLGRFVAVKLVPFSDVDEKSRARFINEARAAASVKHDHVVTLYEVNMAPDGSPYLVMEYVQGASLQWLLRRGSSPVRLVAELLVQAARGLNAIHDAGLVHCDVKPANIMIEGADDHPRAKITDFGLARLVDSERKRTLEHIGGTPQYMSPEQLRGDRELSPRSDLYGLGVTLYESLTGAVPFSGATHAVMHQIEHVEPRRPTLLNPTIPRDLETICLKAMAKVPSHRYASALEFAQDLQRWLQGEPILARPAGTAERLWRWCRRNPRVATLSAAVLSLLLFSTAGSVGAAIWIAGEQAKTKKEQLAAEIAERNATENAAVAKRAQASAEAFGKQAHEQRNLALEAHVNLVGGVHDRLVDTPGTLALRKELLEAAVTGLQKVVGESNDTTDANRTLFLAHQRLGEAYLVLGRTDDARRELELAHRIAAAVAEREPTNDAAHDDLAAAWTSLAEFHIKSLDYKTAQQELQQAHQLLEAIASQQTPDEKLNYRRIRVLSNLGDVALRLNEFAAGESHFQQARKLSDELRTKNLLSSQSRRVMESILRRLGDAALLRGELGVGVELYRQALASAEEAGLAKLSFLERHGLVDAYGRLGLVLVWLGEADESEACLRKGLELNDRAAQIEPDNSALRRKSAIFFQRLADVSWSRGDYEMMRVHLQKALEMHRELSDRDPTSQLSQNDVVICLEQFSRLEMRLEKYREAASWCEQMLSILRARKQAGTLNDPISMNFEVSASAVQKILEHLPAALDAPELPGGTESLVQAGILLERAIVRARHGDVDRAQESLTKAAPIIATLTDVEQSAVQLGVARVHALCARAIQKNRLPDMLAEHERSQLHQYQRDAVAALEKYVAADPFNATYLGFEFELQSLRDNAGFQQLSARFRGPTGSK